MLETIVVGLWRRRANYEICGHGYNVNKIHLFGEFLLKMSKLKQHQRSFNSVVAE